MIKQDKTLLLLGILRSHESHGYEVQSLLSNPLMPIRIGKANAYQILNRFESNGWVTASEEREGNRPPRRVYAITDDGEEVFQQLLRERVAAHTPADHADAVSLNFLALLPEVEAADLLTQRLHAIKARLHELREQNVDGQELHYGVDYLIRHAEFEYAWLSDLIHTLSAQSEDATGE